MRSLKAIMNTALAVIVGLFIYDKFLKKTLGVEGFENR